MSDPLADDLAAKGLDGPVATDDPLAADLAAKGKLDRLKQKHDATMAKVAALQAQPDPMSAGEVGKAVVSDLWNRGAALARGIGTVIRHPIDTAMVPERRRELLRGVDDAVTLGYGRRAADYLSRDVLGSKDSTFAETEAADHAAAPDVRAGGAALGMFLPSPVNKALGAGSGAVSKIVGPATSIPGAAARGLITGTGAYAVGAPLLAAASADSAGHRLQAARDAATDPGGLMLSGLLGAGGGMVKKYVGGAPARAEESELAGLTEGVRNTTRINKYAPNAEQIRGELNKAPDLRAEIKSNPVTAAPKVEKMFGDIADSELEPFYERMAKTGTDQVPLEGPANALKAVRAGLNRVTEKGQIAALDDAMKSLEEVAAENGGKIPAQFLRETATGFQKQGNANVPMFGPVPLSKALKRDIGNALRGSVADHLESLAGDDASGKALSDAFRSANQRVATWARINEIVSEKADYLKGNASPMADLVKGVVDAGKHPYKTALKVIPKAADVVDRKLLGPAVDSAPGRAVAPLASGAMNMFTGMPLVQVIARARANQEQQGE